VLTSAAARQIYEVATQKGSDSWAFKGVVQAMNLVNGHSVHYRDSFPHQRSNAWAVVELLRSPPTAYFSPCLRHRAR